METHYALTFSRAWRVNRSHQNAIYQDQSVPQIVEKSSAGATACAVRIFCSR